MKLNVKLFADGADKNGMIEMYKNSIISGFTTNPTLMKAAGVKDYKAFALDILSTISDKSISFEVFSDDFDEMEKQALDIASWGEIFMLRFLYLIPHSSIELINSLSDKGVKINVTAMMTLNQVESVLPALKMDLEGMFLFLLEE